MSVTRLTYLMLAVSALALAACSGAPSRVQGPPPPSARVVTSETDTVFDLLMKGDEPRARKQLKALIKRDPMNPTAQLLNDSIGREPKDLLGPQSYPYVVRAGDTVQSLASRFLGNRLKAYQLLRYNGLKAPATLTLGQVLRIPGEPPRPEPVRRPDLVQPRAAPAPAPGPRPKPVAPKPAAPTGNPVAARQLRAAGLAALNAGNVDRAVALLRRAASVDPGNPVIAKDLARAERIAATVKARK